MRSVTRGDWKKGGREEISDHQRTYENDDDGGRERGREDVEGKMKVRGMKRMIVKRKMKVNRTHNVMVKGKMKVDRMNKIIMKEKMKVRR